MEENKEIEEGLEDLGLVVARTPIEEVWINIDRNVKNEIVRLECDLEKLPHAIEVNKEILEFVQTKLNRAEGGLKENGTS